MFNKKVAKSALESLMFIWGEPLDVAAAADACDITRDEAMECFLELQDEYASDSRGLAVRRVGNSFQFVTKPENADYIEKLCTPVKVKKLSQSAMEVLAIIAYRQPVTKAVIESIRGVRSDRIIEGLMHKDLIRETGRSKGIGRPILYGTTDNFLKTFGFETLKDLPEIPDIGEALDADDDAYESDGLQMSIDVTEQGNQQGDQ